MPVVFHKKTLPRTFPIHLLLSAIGAVLFVGLTAAPWSAAQVNVTTQKYDNSRSGLNLQEHILTPSNVNVNTFGKLFSNPVDGEIVGQPLFIPNVAIPGLGSHNTVFVATMHDSVYAFDAQSNTGTNAQPLWHVNFTNPALGITSVPIADQTCGNLTAFKEIGIVPTMVIDPVSKTLYVLAKTEENGAFVHRLHALDVTTGNEKFGGPVQITASVVVGGITVPFSDKFEMSRPGLGLMNGTVYVSFGSLGCKNSGPTATGWFMSYNAKTLQQTGVFATNPKNGYGASIWQSGVAPAIDSAGNIYVSTANGPFNADQGGSSYGDSLLKFNSSATLLDYFTPYNQQHLNDADLDLGAGGVLLLPDQSSSHPHEMLAAGKEGSIYVVDRDNLGRLEPDGNPNLPQFLPFVTGPVNGVPVYWNNTVFVGGKNTPLQSYSFANGLLSVSPIHTSLLTFSNPNALQVSANANSNAILWAMEGRGPDAKLYGFDALTLNQLYSTADLTTRDQIGGATHFATPTVAQGRVYIGGTSNLVTYGLFRNLLVASGDGQSGVVNTTLPVSLIVKAQDPYGRGVTGFPVTFNDGGAGGIFNPATVSTDSTGRATTIYTLSKTSGTVHISASSPGFTDAKFTETALAGTATLVKTHSGFNQSAPVNTPLPAPVSAAVKDAWNNPVPNVVVTFSDGGAGGQLSATTATTDSNGFANVNYTTPPTAQVLFITATAAGVTTPAKFKETATNP
jgi:hypothetical protein